MKKCSLSSTRNAARAALVFPVLLFATAVTAQVDMTNEPGAQAKAPLQEMSGEVMQSFLHLQQQVHATQLAVERSRLEAEVASTRNLEALNARLKIVETALDQAQRDSSSALLEAGQQIQESNRQTLLLAGLFATAGFLALAVTGWLQWRTTARLGSLAAPSGFPPFLSLPPGEVGPGVRTTAQAASLQLKDALGRLEHRLFELESGRPLPHTVGSGPSDSAAPSNESSSAAALTTLIREGEALLAKEDAEKAILHFDAILSKHPGHPEVLLLKGAALERLRRDQDAIDCYDQAIQADKNLTMAYLHKGGLYNRMERFSEAMECYEQALRVQEGRPAVS
jgi:tetratricopeptide (TPR) repeat protein